MAEISTIKVFYKPGKYEMIINESDFDDKIHEKIGEKTTVKAGKSKKAVETIEDDDVKALIGEE